MNKWDRLIEVASGEIGYLEKSEAAAKANPAVLDSKTEGAGDGNYTKYARDQWKEKYFNSSKQGKPWCAVFAGWCYLNAYGKSTALKLQCQPVKGNAGAGCKSAANYYREKGRFTHAPQAGDQIFFGESGNESHTGIVVGVEGQYVITIEGNTNPGEGVVENGGQVAKKKYKVNNSRISGYGRPDWGLIHEGSGEAPLRPVPDETELPVKGDDEDMTGKAKVVCDKGSTVRMRESGSTDADVIVALPKGTKVNVLGGDGSWSRISVEGYMMTQFLEGTEDGGLG